jgi:hypothetical protein
VYDILASCPTNPGVLRTRKCAYPGRHPGPNAPISTISVGSGGASERMHGLSCSRRMQRALFRGRSRLIEVCGGRLGTPTTPYGGATAPHEAHALVGVRARHYSSPSPSTAAHATAHLYRRFSAPRFKIVDIYESSLLGLNASMEEDESQLKLPEVVASNQVAPLPVGAEEALEVPSPEVVDVLPRATEPNAAEAPVEVRSVCVCRVSNHNANRTDNA